jgi:single-strand DNA-binding protein
MYLNKVLIVGNLTRDPELKSLPSGVQVASMGIATNRVWRDKEGNRKEDTEFHNVVVFGRQAETSAQYLRKGSQVMVEGRLQTRSWEADGQKKYRTEIVADRVQFGTRRGEGASGSEGESLSGKGKKGDDDSIQYPEETVNPEDIPF